MMFYANPDCALKLTGVFHVRRADAREANTVAANRRHTSIAYRVQGESVLRFGENRLVAAADSVTCIPAHMVFERIGTAETLIVLHLQGFGTPDDTIEVINHAESVKPLFQKLLSVWETKDETSYNRSMKLVYSIFEALQNLREPPQRQVPAVIRPGVELLQRRYKDASLRIADLADVCYISEVYFREIYHRHFGQAPQKTLVALRFQCACELLSSGYYTQKDAARLSGFSDVKYFRTAFKKHFGVTPSEYLRKPVPDVSDET